MNISSKKIKKAAIHALPYAVFAYAGNKLSFGYRIAEGGSLEEKLLPFLSDMGNVFASPIPSFHIADVTIGLLTAGIMWVVLYFKKKNRKKYRNGTEYGSARWGEEKDIEPFADHKNLRNNIILSATESLTMGKASEYKYFRNKNIMIIGGSGSGKSYGAVLPALLQMNCSYIVTDPKGQLLVDTGKMLLKGRDTGKKDNKGNTIYEPYKVKVFNTIDFRKSMHYNPFVYIYPETREKDIIKLVEVLIKNTNGNKPSNGDDFWEKAEKLLYMAYIALIFTFYPEEERNFETLIDLINMSECREDDEEFKNAVDIQFEFLEYWLNGNFPANAKFSEQYQEIIDNYQPTDEQKRLGMFAVKQYKSYKLAAGKTAKSILISCSTRLAPFAIDEVLEITSYDELGLDKLGDELSALFVIISDTDATFNFLVAIMYSQMFNLLCTKADTSPGGKLKNHVRCLLDEFANIGEIPNFDKLIATIRSREISATIILQTKSQLKAIYKDNSETIEGNCDTMVFLGGKEKTTLKDISEALGKETIDLFNENITRGQSESFGMNYQKLGKDLKSPDELAVMDGDKCIVMVRGVRPFLSDKYNTSKHPEFERTGMYSDNNKMDIAKYVRSLSERKAKTSRKTLVTQYECADK